MKLRSRLATAGPGKWAAVTALVLVLGGSSLALASGEGDPLRIGVRNPHGGSATHETEIAARVPNGYGTRQSNFNQGSGGGAIYGCRAITGTQPCVRANNLSTGHAFEFRTAGSEGGSITVNGKDAKPFTTNAHGVATGLNADQVDGQGAGDILASAQALNMFAAIDGQTATLTGKRGASSMTRVGMNPGRYQVTFASDVSKCAYSATETTTTDFGAAAVRFVSPSVLEVATHNAAGAAADRDVHLTVIC